MDKNCPCRLWTARLVTSGCLLMGHVLCKGPLSTTARRAWVLSGHRGTAHLHTPPQGQAGGTLHPPPTAVRLRNPSCPSGSGFGFRIGEAALMWGGVWELCCAGPVCHTPLTTHIPLGILTALNFFFLFSPELRQEEEKDVFSLFFLLSLLYLSDLSLWEDTPMLNLCENIDSKNFHFHVHFSPAYKKWVIQ